jgi:predicted Zn-dependent protease
LNIIRSTWGFKSPESPDVTFDPPNRTAGPRKMVGDAARALPEDDPLAHVFFEERTDLRMTLASSGLKDAVATRTRGAAIAGRRSVHLTDPESMHPGPMVSEGAYRGIEESAQSDDKWVADLESTIVGAGKSTSVGRRHPFWSVKLVSFQQEIWVGSPGGRVVQDIRRGSRMELRVQVGEEPTACAVEELILGSDRTLPVTDAFARAFERAEARRSITSSPKPGSTTAVFAPGVAGIMAHEMIGHALEGDVVARGLSWIRAADFPAAATPVTVIDDPRRGRGAWTIDDEGISSRETLLVDRGRPVGMLLDKSSAGALRTVSTGHGRRSSYLEAVRPRMGCTFVGPGDDDPADVLRATRSGVFIRRMTAGHTDPTTGRASFLITDADRILDGHLAEPLDVFVLELDGYESWRSIDRVAHDLVFDTCIGSCVRDGQPLAVSVGAPTIRIGVARVHS